MEAERQSIDSDIEMATNDQAGLLMQTTIIDQTDQIDFNICFKFMLIVIILNFMAPPIFIDFYYGMQAIEAKQYTLGNGQFDDKYIVILTKSDEMQSHYYYSSAPTPIPTPISVPVQPTPISAPVQPNPVQTLPIQPIQPAPCFFVELYLFYNGILYSLLAFIAIIAIASVSDINRCIKILLLMSSLIIFSFHVVWIVLIFKYF